MSVVIEILKPIHDAMYIPPTEKRHNRDLHNKDFNSDMSREEYIEKWCGYYMINGEKNYNVKEEPINRSKYYSRRFNKSIKEVEEKFKDIVVSKYNGNYKGVPVSKILWRQGWYFNKKLLRNGGLYYSVTFDHMKKLLDRFIDFHEHNGVEAYRACINTFEDGMIFFIGF